MRAKVRRVFGLFAFIFLVWGCYRLIFRLPENLEEFFLKPIIWLGPTFYLVFKIEKRSWSSLGFTGKNFGRAVFWGMNLGLVFSLSNLLANYLKFQDLKVIDGKGGSTFFLPLAISLVTAISEEVVFRGYLLTRLEEVLKDETLATGLNASLFVLIHLPISIFTLHYSPVQLFIYSFLVGLFSLGSSFVFKQTGNIFASILAHSFWSWPMILFN